MLVNTRSERSAVAAFLDLVALRRDPESQMSALSGGNQQKAIVARWFAAKAKLFLLDDPTSGVDVATRPEIHEQIRAACAKGAGVLLVSTDIDELAELSDRVIVLTRGRMKGELRGRDITSARVFAAMTGQEVEGPGDPTA
jgi:ABC-type sugar transport system ATPase subunit